mmetsp:Transcript_6830/g.16652  ORF Transcript_6830/g.16652 Transcript_6830/m.16652 type:complete len:82 (+) Transcript_6830:110-355(+)
MKIKHTVTCTQTGETHSAESDVPESCFLPENVPVLRDSLMKMKEDFLQAIHKMNGSNGRELEEADVVDNEDDIEDCDDDAN